MKFHNRTGKPIPFLVPDQHGSRLTDGVPGQISAGETALVRPTKGVNLNRDAHHAFALIVQSAKPRLETRVRVGTGAAEDEGGVSDPGGESPVIRNKIGVGVALEKRLAEGDAVDRDDIGNGKSLAAEGVLEIAFLNEGGGLKLSLRSRGAGGSQ